jgi:hypothetical protein
MYWNFSGFLYFSVSFFFLYLSPAPSLCFRLQQFYFTEADFVRPTPWPRTCMQHRASRTLCDAWSGIRTRHLSIKAGCVYLQTSPPALMLRRWAKTRYLLRSLWRNNKILPWPCSNFVYLFVPLQYAIARDLAFLFCAFIARSALKKGIIERSCPYVSSSVSKPDADEIWYW